eukprot:18929-Rhodomonas_salina.3
MESDGNVRCVCAHTSLFAEAKTAPSQSPDACFSGDAIAPGGRPSSSCASGACGGSCRHATRAQVSASVIPQHAQHTEIAANRHAQTPVSHRTTCNH